MFVAVAIIGWTAGTGNAQAADAFVVYNAGGVPENAQTRANITTFLTAAGYTVTDGTAVPGVLTTYAQVWDLRYNSALTVPETTIYTTYITGGGSLFLMGENVGAGAARNPTIVTFISALGGGTTGAVVAPSSVSETVQAPFTGPNTIGAVTWRGSGALTSAARGAYVTKGTTNGSAVVFYPGSLTAAPLGTLITVFDVNFLDNVALAAETAVAKNLIAYLAAPTPIAPPSSTPAPAPTGTVPTITQITNQLIAVSSSTTVSFTVGGTVILDALRVAATSSDRAFAQTLTLVKLDSNGHWTLQVFAQDGRLGSAVITVTVSEPGQASASTSFTVATLGSGTGSATAPINLVASTSGSGIALTWSAPASGTPGKYIVSAGTTPGASDLSVFVTPDAATSYVIPMVPPGTYFFRVRAATDALSPASNEASVLASGSADVMGVPTGVASTVSGGEITVTWNAPLGPTPPLYIVEFGTGDGGSDVALVTAVNPTHTRRVSAGYYFMRLRSYNGGRPSGPSNETSIPVGLDGCAAPPVVPVLLPAVISGRVVTLSWLPPDSWAPNGATAADSYRIDLTSSSGATSGVASAGAGTSATWTGAAGSYSARVTALNRCGASAPSAAVNFLQP